MRLLVASGVTAVTDAVGADVQGEASMPKGRTMKKLMIAVSTCALVAGAGPPSIAQETAEQAVPPRPPAVDWAPASLNVPVKKDNIYASVASFTGEFVMNAYTNADQTKRFWTNVPVNGRPLALRLKYVFGNNWVSNCYNRPACADHSHQWLGYYMVDDMQKHRTNQIDAVYAAEVPAAFEQLVRSLQAPLNETQTNDTALKNFVDVGHNTVHYVITPRSSTWSVLLHLYTVDADGKVAVVQETYLDQNTGGTAPVIALTVTP